MGNGLGAFMTHIFADRLRIKSVGLTGRLAPCRYQMLAAGREPSGDDLSINSQRTLLRFG